MANNYPTHMDLFISEANAKHTVSREEYQPPLYHSMKAWMFLNYSLLSLLIILAGLVAWWII